jgi:hypothetical protein
MTQTCDACGPVEEEVVRVEYPDGSEDHLCADCRADLKTGIES